MAPDICIYCQLDTAGNHQADCPLYNLIKKQNSFKITTTQSNPQTKDKKVPYWCEERDGEWFLCEWKVPYWCEERDGEWFLCEWAHPDDPLDMNVNITNIKWLKELIAPNAFE